MLAKLENFENNIPIAVKLELYPFDKKKKNRSQYRLRSNQKYGRELPLRQLSHSRDLKFKKKEGSNNYDKNSLIFENRARIIRIPLFNLAHRSKTWTDEVVKKKSITNKYRL